VSRTAGPAESEGRQARRGRARLTFAAAFALAASFAGRDAAADEGRLVLGTHDPALASALSVAVSPRGLSVVELPDALLRASDVADARRAVSVQDAVAVVWLCDDAAGAHALCFCDRDGHLTVKPISVVSPLAPPDAAALALSVKVLLGPPPQLAATPAPVVRPARQSLRMESVVFTADLPSLAVELRGGARVPDGLRDRSALRVGLDGVFAPEALDRNFGVGVGASAGPASVGNYARSVDDLAFGLFARGQRRVGPLVWQLDLGPTVHRVSAAEGPTQHRTQLSIDALAGAVWTFGRFIAGARLGVVYVPLADQEPVLLANDGFGTVPLSLPRWNGEALLTLGATFLGL
jgi:hypothetical protein